MKWAVRYTFFIAVAIVLVLVGFKRSAESSDSCSPIAESGTVEKIHAYLAPWYRMESQSGDDVEDGRRSVEHDRDSLFEDCGDTYLASFPIRTAYTDGDNYYVVSGEHLAFEIRKSDGYITGFFIEGIPMIIDYGLLYGENSR
ncbi:MAG: hypothetical protein GXP03_06175 [Alphaproteobacteria bacterium]|nr:hypothetical protein [Alphaproteobacteria bacterium]